MNLARGWPLLFLLTACTTVRRDPELRARGSIEITARLLEVSDAARQRPLYNHTGVFLYQVLDVRRGELKRGETIRVGHYNPWKPRAQAEDKWVRGVGGSLFALKSGEVHHLALEPNLEEHFMGGVIDPHADTSTGTVYWAVWTQSAQNDD